MQRVRANFDLVRSILKVGSQDLFNKQTAAYGHFGRTDIDFNLGKMDGDRRFKKILVDSKRSMHTLND